MPWARASSLERHLECPASSMLAQFDRGAWRPGYLAKGVVGVPEMFLPRVQTEAEVAQQDEWGGWGDWGTGLHAAKAGEPEATDPWLTLVEPYREVLWPSRLGLHEVTLSFDCRHRVVQRFMGPKAEADAWKMSRSEDCVVGTTDWFAALPGGEPWIDDLKTGWQDPEVQTPQMMFYLLCRIILEEQDSGHRWQTGRLSITHWPRRAGEEGEPRRVDSKGKPLWRQVSDTALRAFEEDVVNAWQASIGQLDRGFPLPLPGHHCLYCPSALICNKANA